MPNVGGRQFSYTPAGRRKAKRMARRTGQPMQASGANPSYGRRRRRGARPVGTGANPGGMWRNAPRRAGRSPMAPAPVAPRPMAPRAPVSRTGSLPSLKRTAKFPRRKLGY